MASEPVGTGSTTTQGVARSIPERQSAPGQASIGAPVNGNEHSETAANIVVPRESPSTLISVVETPMSSVQKSMAMTSRLSKLLSELDVSVAEFRKNYELFVKKNSNFFLIDDEFNDAFRNAEASDDIKRSAQIFGDRIWGVLQSIETKKTTGRATWLNKLANFLTNVYPVAMLSLNLAAAIAEVSLDFSMFNLQATSFIPLKGAAGGLGIILQVNKTI